jgi:hypothetical protein
VLRPSAAGRLANARLDAWRGGLDYAARWRGVEAFIGINNLLDNRYETFGTIAAKGCLLGNLVEHSLTTAPPINVLAGLQYGYELSVRSRPARERLVSPGGTACR